jgi:hypothetical protein
MDFAALCPKKQNSSNSSTSESDVATEWQDEYGILQCLKRNVGLEPNLKYAVAASIPYTEVYCSSLLTPVTSAADIAPKITE